MDNQKEKSLGYIFAGIFVLGVILLMSLSFADVYNKATTYVQNGSNVKMLVFNVSGNGSGVGNTWNNITINNTGTSSVGNNITNVTLSNGTLTFYNDSFGAFPVIVNVASGIAKDGSNNFTINFTINSSIDVTDGATVQANVTAINTGGNLSHSSAPFNSSTTTIDGAGPTVSASCNDVEVGDALDCSCSGSDSSNVNSTSTSSDSPDGTDTQDSSGSDFTFTCTATDWFGRQNSTTATYSVNEVSSGGSGGGSGGGTSTGAEQQPSHSFSMVTPGVAAVAKNFDPEVGLKEIRIEVNNEAQNVVVDVTKYNNKPAQVSVSKEGKVNQYLQIDVSNVENSLDRATVTSKVEKSWASQNNVKKENIALFRFDETAEEWVELNTSFDSEDDTYYYYNTELSSFSYFAIGEKEVFESETGANETEDGETISEGDLTLLWIVLGAIVVAIIIWYFMQNRGKK